MPTLPLPHGAGTIKPGHSALGAPGTVGDTLDIVSAFQSFGGYAAGLISEEQRCDIVRNSCPGPGACGGMYTANTMASAIEALGMSLPYSSSTPAEDPLKRLECRMAGRCGQAAGKADGVGRVKFLVLTAV